MHCFNSLYKIFYKSCIILNSKIVIGNTRIQRLSNGVHFIKYLLREIGDEGAVIKMRMIYVA
jgi:hypothetical protein